MTINESLFQLFSHFSKDSSADPIEEALFSTTEECSCRFVVVATGLPGEECKPREVGGGQAESQVPQPGPEARRLRLPDEETTERGRSPGVVYYIVGDENSGETGVCLRFDPHSRHLSVSKPQNLYLLIHNVLPLV